MNMEKSRWLRRWGIWLPGVLLLVAVIVFLVWAANPAGAMPAAEIALQGGARVSVVEENTWVSFWPKERLTQTGFIFYPGGRVDYRAYAPLARAVAEAGYPAVLVKMPLSLAVFDPNRAEKVIAAYPQVQHWVLGGHSLGGAMAAAFVYEHPQAVDGLIFYAAYPADNNSLSNLNLWVTSVYATKDGLATPEKIEQSRALLPEGTDFFVIEGGNHAQFSWYGPQKGDGEATISRLDQQVLVLRATLDLLAKVEEKP
jgi:predicted esterase